MKSVSKTIYREMDASKKKTNDKVRAGKVQKNKDKKEQMITVKKLADIVGSNDDSSELEVVQAVIDYIRSLQAKIDGKLDRPVMNNEATNLTECFKAAIH